MPEPTAGQKARSNAQAWDSSDETPSSEINSLVTKDSPISSEYDGELSTSSVNSNRSQDWLPSVAEIETVGDTLPWWRRPACGVVDDFVISGISGRFPESSSIGEFEQNLYDGVDMITADNRRWELGWKGLPHRTGKLKELGKFDAAFFNVSPKQATNMDPQLRNLLEVVYEAMLDSGYNPAHLRGTKTGVFVGCSSAESEVALAADPDTMSGYCLTGCTRSMFANRISYTFDLGGPSFPVDTACSSSLLAIQLAVDALRQGDCDAAIVAGSQLALNPLNSLAFNRLGMTADDGKCKSFDADGRGYVRSEAVCAILIQKASVARRVYATVVHAKSNTDGFKEAGITVPNGLRQLELLRAVYKECGVDPSQVNYVEAHGTGTKVGDPQEAHAITEVFCRERTTPLLIGSVKSNMGHPEPASGLCSVAKVLLSMERGEIPPNLHFTEPNPYIPALMDGRIKVVTERTKWEGGYVGINSFGFGGANTHILLRQNLFTVDREQSQKPDTPILLCTAARTEQGVKSILSEAEKNQNNKYFTSMLSELSNLNPSQAIYRGFSLLNRDQAAKTVTDVQKVPLASLQLENAEPGQPNRPVYFIYSGMGSQWTGMAQELIRLPVFKDSLLECDAALKPLGVDLIAMLMSRDEKLMKNTLNCMITITATQIALTDTLRSIGIRPSGIMGHSTGEMACGYADGCLNRTQTMMLAYQRGKCVLQGGLSGTGGMAAVGLTWEQAIKRVPTGIVAACHNGKDSVTISGDAHKVAAFVEELKKEDIFAKMVDSSGVAFHSPSMQKVKTEMTSQFRKIIASPRPRSQCWISTSVPVHDKDSDLAMTCSAEYQVNNAMSPVLFYEALQRIPENALTIEIGPSALLSAILRRSLPESCTNVGLLRKNADNELECLLNSIGKIYQAGLNVSVHRLFGQVSYPVPRGTPKISPMITWDHTNDWFVADYRNANMGGFGGVQATASYTIEPHNPESEDQYLVDHVIDGRVLFPFTGYVVLAWKTLAKLNGLDLNKTPFTLENFTVSRPAILSDIMKFHVVIHPGDGLFEVIEGETSAATGKITLNIEQHPLIYAKAKTNATHSDDIKLTSKDIYKGLLLRGYEYGTDFRLIDQLQGTGGRLKWTDRWIPFLDSCIQTWLMADGEDTLRLPTLLRHMRIDPTKHEQSIYTAEDGERYVDLVSHHTSKGCIIGGVEFAGLSAQTIARMPRSSGELYLEKHHFVEYRSMECLHNHPDVRAMIKEYKGMLKQNVNDAWQRAKTSNILNSLPCLSLLTDCLDALDTDTPTNPSTLPLASLYDQLFTSTTSLESVHSFVMGAEDQLLLDPIYSGSMFERCVRPVIDTAQQNTGGHYYKWAVIEPKGKAQLNTLIQFACSHPLAEIEWLLVSACKDSFDEFDDEFCLQNNVQTLIHDFSGTLGELNEQMLGRCDVVVMDKALHEQLDVERYLLNIGMFLRDDGFVIAIENTTDFALTLLWDTLRLKGQIPAIGIYMDHEHLLNTFRGSALRAVGWQTDSVLSSTVYLLRRTQTATRDNVFVDVDDVTEFEWIKPMQHLVEESEKEQAAKKNIFWLTSMKTRDHGLLGLSLSLRDESAKENAYRMIMDASLEQTEPLQLDQPVIQEAIINDLHVNMYRDGKIGSFGISTVPIEQQTARRECEHAFINTTSKGDMKSITWIESATQFFGCEDQPNPHHQVITVYYAALNFRDIMLASGRLPPDAIPGAWIDRERLLGLEFVGRTATGKRVMGIVWGAALATTLVVDERCCYDIPDAWTMEEAATVPIAYSTAYYSLYERGKMKSGDKVLIHSGTGAVGQAAIELAMAYGCEVFTTVGTPEKRAYLKQRFPSLPDDHVYSSRSTEFELQIMDVTEGTGVNIVLNSLSEDKLQASVRCLAEHGQFLEIGKFDLARNSSLGMMAFLKSITFHGILLDAFHLGFGDNPAHRAMQKFIDGGDHLRLVRPLPRTVFPVEKVEDAFRYMTTGNHIGKVLVNIRAEESHELQAVPRTIKVDAMCRSYCHPAHSYLITGGLGGFGLELAKFLVRRGAKKLVLTSRNGIKTGYQARCVELWKRKNVKVHISTLDISREVETKQLIEDCQTLGPLGGIFHLAMVLRDALFENQNSGNFKEVAKMKYWATKNLDQVTRTHCDENLKWFVMFSSITAGRGNAGQTAYGYGNSSMERIVEERRRDGLSGMAIEWGAIGDVGVVLENMGHNDVNVAGTLPQRIHSCMQCLDTFMTWNHPIVGCYVRAQTGRRTGTKKNIIEAIAKVLGVTDMTSLNLDASLTEFGIDSLMGVELRQLLERDYNIVVSMKDIRNLTLRKLQQMAEGGGSSIDQKGSADSNDDSLTSMLNRLTAEDIKTVVWEDIVPLNKSESKQEPVYFLHAIEGVAAPLKELGQLITAPAFCIQNCESAPQDSIESLAAYYIEALLKHNARPLYRLVGYSYGACVGFEMACQMQERCIPVQLVLLEGSHQYWQQYAHRYRQEYGLSDVADLTNNVLFQSEMAIGFAAFYKCDREDLRKKLYAEPSWERRLEVTCEQIAQKGMFNSAEEVRWPLNSIIVKFNLADNDSYLFVLSVVDFNELYKPAGKYNGDLTLLRASTELTSNMAKDYGLSEVIDGQLTIVEIEGDHDSLVALDGSAKQSAQLINEIYN